MYITMDDVSLAALTSEKQNTHQMTPHHITAPKVDFLAKILGC
jgi:hypothetical protein